MAPAGAALDRPDLRFRVPCGFPPLKFETKFMQLFLVFPCLPCWSWRTVMFHKHKVSIIFSMITKLYAKSILSFQWVSNCLNPPSGIIFYSSSSALKIKHFRVYFSSSLSLSRIERSFAVKCIIAHILPLKRTTNDSNIIFFRREFHREGLEYVLT
jgi:hypothetical protein